MPILSAGCREEAAAASPPRWTRAAPLPGNPVSPTTASSAALRQRPRLRLGPSTLIHIPLSDGSTFWMVVSPLPELSRPSAMRRIAASVSAARCCAAVSFRCFQLFQPQLAVPDGEQRCQRLLLLWLQFQTGLCPHQFQSRLVRLLFGQAAPGRQPKVPPVPIAGVLRRSAHAAAVFDRTRLMPAHRDALGKGAFPERPVLRYLKLDHPRPANLSPVGGAGSAIPAG